MMFMFCHFGVTSMKPWILNQPSFGKTPIHTGTSAKTSFSRAFSYTSLRVYWGIVQDDKEEQATRSRKAV